jgi:hypothetical protein
VVVLLADLTLGRDAGRPGDDARVRRVAVEFVALPHLERRVERHRPAIWIVVVSLRAAQLVEHRQVLGDVVGDSVGDQALVDRPVRASLAAGAIVGDEDDHCVLALPGLFQVVQQPSDLLVGVAQEAGVDLGHPPFRASAHPRVAPRRSTYLLVEPTAK